MTRLCLPAAVAFLCLTGCAGQDSSERTYLDLQRDQRTAEAPVSVGTQSGVATRARVRTRGSDAGARGQPGPRGPGSRRIVAPTGVVVVTPPPPRAAAQISELTCGEERVIASGKEKRLLAPPAPGISARRLDARTVLVRWSFRRLPGRCMPIRLRLRVDVSGDILPGREIVARVRSKTGRARLFVPPDLARVDAVHASALAADGAQSNTVSVAIR